MNAADIVKALGGTWHGSYGLVPGPGHSAHDRSMKVMDGRDGDVLCHSFGNDDWRVFKDYLRDQGLLPYGDTAPIRRNAPGKQNSNQSKPDNNYNARRTAAALQIWRASLRANSRSFAAKYLRARCITIPAPTSIRSHTALIHGPRQQYYPAMVAAVQGPDGRITGIHRTFLNENGTGKLRDNAPKMALGPISAGAVRLAAAGDTLGIAEGIETGLSAIQLFGVPVWCGLGARLHQIALPEIARHIIIFADNGAAGYANAEKASNAFTRQGRHVTLRYPPDELGDWNDYLQARAI